MTDDVPDEFAGPSKSQRKREMNELQQLAVAITQLQPDQRATLPLDDPLREAIEQTATIQKREALRRHFQYLGKLMRRSDHEAIRDAMQEIELRQQKEARALHQVERWRDRLLADDGDALGEFIDQHPHCDRQTLRNLVQMARRDLQVKGSPANARKLFRLLRDVINSREISE